jgi:hypothetical protein
MMMMIIVNLLEMSFVAIKYVDNVLLLMLLMMMMIVNLLEMSFLAIKYVDNVLLLLLLC